MRQYLSLTEDKSLLLLSVFPYLALGVYLFLYAGKESLLAVTLWFDPLFLRFNVVLLLLAVLIVPFTTYFYVCIMKGEKERRLRRDLPRSEWAANQTEIEEMIEHQFCFRNYLGPAAILMLVIALGISCLLLLKPVPHFDQPGQGLNYGRGANMLLAGPFIEYFVDDHAEFYHRVLMALTAFLFGFLGAYVYFISHLVRSYFTLDLSPNTFVSSTVRMVTASALALVLYFALPSLPFLEHEHHGRFHDWLPVLSFLLGYFPSRGFQLLETWGGRVMQMRRERYNARSLSTLPGMSLAHAVRLSREGFDNVENLSHADPLALAVRTGFRYAQLRDWVEQAWLDGHLGGDYDAFVEATGVTSRTEFREFLRAWEREKRQGRAVDHLASVVEAEAEKKPRKRSKASAAGGNSIRTKLDVIASLVCQEG